MRKNQTWGKSQPQKPGVSPVKIQKFDQQQAWIEAMEEKEAQEQAEIDRIEEGFLRAEYELD